MSISTESDAAPEAGAVAQNETRARSVRVGMVYALGAYVWWGFAPFYFRMLGHVPAPVILAHRIVWSVALLAVLLWVGKQWNDVRTVARQRRVYPWLIASTLLVACNWLVFIHAVSTHRLVEASLGYFVNPLVSVVLGMVFLGERLRRWQWVAAAIAAAGLVYLTLARGGLPWIALALPLSFGMYGLIRKRAPVGALTGLFIETALLAPAAGAYVVWAHARGAAAMNTPGTIALLSLSGVMTAVPMLWFVAAARRLPLVTIGFLQYLTPSLQLLTAVVVFGEEFGKDRAVAFGMIWLAVAVFLVEGVRARRG